MIQQGEEQEEHTYNLLNQWIHGLLLPLHLMIYILPIHVYTGSNVVWEKGMMPVSLICALCILPVFDIQPVPGIILYTQ